jgi:hypothetical protein
MANEVATRGIVARLLSRFGAQADGSQSQAAGQRIGKYGESYVLSPGSPKSLLAEEGSYFTANNAQTSIATPGAAMSNVTTSPWILIQNSAGAGSGGPVITLDYVTLINGTAGTGAGIIEFVFVKDTVLRYSSAGSILTPVKANSAGPGSIAQVYSGQIVASAASGAAATLIGLRIMKNGQAVVGDSLWLQFGSMDGFMQIATATSTFSIQAAPPCVLNPGETGLLYLLMTVQSVASNWYPEIGWWEK